MPKLDRDGVNIYYEVHGDGSIKLRRLPSQLDVGVLIAAGTLLPSRLTREVGGYREMFAALLPNLEFRYYEAHRGQIPGSPRECDAWMCTGSKYSVYDGTPWIAMERVTCSSPRSASEPVWSTTTPTIRSRTSRRSISPPTAPTSSPCPTHRSAIGRPKPGAWCASPNAARRCAATCSAHPQTTRARAAPPLALRLSLRRRPAQLAFFTGARAAVLIWPRR